MTTRLISRLSILLLVALCVTTFVCFEPQSVQAAWGTGNSTCSNREESASLTTLGCTLTNNLEAGNVAVVVCAGDNVSASGNTNDHGNVTDSSGNTYTKAYEFTEGTGGAGGGATVSVHFSKLTTQLTDPGAVITCNYNTAVTDRVMHLIGEFTITSGNVVSVEGTPQGAESDGGDAPSQVIGSLTNAEYLFVRGIATESNAAVSMTATTSYSLPANPSDGCFNTATGGEASDMGACSEFRIFTGTGDTSDPTLVDTTNDNASVYVALKEAAPPEPPAGQIIIIGRWQDNRCVPLFPLDARWENNALVECTTSRRVIITSLEPREYEAAR